MGKDVEIYQGNQEFEIPIHSFEFLSPPILSELEAQGRSIIGDVLFRYSQEVEISILIGAHDLKRKFK